MALNGVEIVIITVMAVVAAVWTLILLFDRTGVSRRPVFSALVLVILGLLGVVFYGIYEDKSNLWWIIPTVGISLITLILVFRIPILRGRQKTQIRNFKTQNRNLVAEIVPQLKKNIKDEKSVGDLYLEELNSGRMSREDVTDDANELLQNRIEYRGVVPRNQIKSSRRNDKSFELSSKPLKGKYTSPPSGRRDYMSASEGKVRRFVGSEGFSGGYERKSIEEEYEGGGFFSRARNYVSNLFG